MLVPRQPGLIGNEPPNNPMEGGSGFKTSITRGAQATSAYIFEANVIDVNFVNWTVDCFTSHDQRFFPNVQVASPYMHPNRGEGIYAMPEVMSKCLVCIPSDGPPPYVIGFVMRMERKNLPEGESVDAGGGAGASTYAGNRKRAKPGDIVMKGRDGNFVVLHRGGVLQVGATELAQRIYIPLRNVITDISQNYEHFNMGGAINWGISTGETTDNPETEYRQVFRLFANDEMADVRVAIGKVHQPLLEPPSPDGEQTNITDLEIGTDPEEPVVVEVSIAPQCFNAETGAPDVKKAQAGTTMKFLFDRKGGGFLRAEGSILVRIKKRLKVIADQGIEFNSEKDFIVKCRKFRVECSGGLELTSAGVVSVNSGTAPVALVGSPVEVNIPPNTIPGISVPLTIAGFISTSKSTFVA